MYGNVSPAALAARFAVLAERHGGSSAADRAELGRRKLMSAISAQEPATLGEVARSVARGAPAVSRAVETWSAPAWSSAHTTPTTAAGSPCG